MSVTQSLHQRMSSAGASRRSGYTLIEMMILVAIVVIFTMATGLALKSAPSHGLDDSLAAMEALRAQMALMQAGQLGDPAAFDGAPFDGVDVLNRLPNGAGTIQVLVIGGGVYKVTLEVTWQRRPGKAKSLSLAQLVAAPPSGGGGGKP